MSHEPCGGWKNITHGNIYPEISKALREHFGSLSGNDSPEAASKYDAYAPALFPLLRQDASDTKMAEHLRRIETEVSAVGTMSKERLERVIRALRAIDMETPDAP